MITAATPPMNNTLTPMLTLMSAIQFRANGFSSRPLALRANINPQASDQSADESVTSPHFSRVTYQKKAG